MTSTDRQYTARRSIERALADATAHLADALTLLPEAGLPAGARAQITDLATKAHTATAEARTTAQTAGSARPWATAATEDPR